MNKKIFIATLGLIFSIKSYASEYKDGYYSSYDGIPLSAINIHIHKVTLQYNRETCEGVYLSTKVGYLQEDNTCQYLEETDRTKNYYSICTTETNFLSGYRLSELVKPGYNCAATVAYTFLGTVIGEDKYQLFSDGGKYTRTEPAEGTIIIP